MKQQNKFFSFFCFFVLCFCLLVILWGAWVRISHSGDGCGQSWPSCQGQYLMDSGEQQKTWIEWIHRATSGLFGIMVIWLFIWSFLKFPFRHPICKSALCVFLFTISEALIGAGLVLAGLTGENISPVRVLVMNLHLLNSVLLVSSLFICWRLSIGKRFSFFNCKGGRRDQLSKALLIFVFFLIAFFGSVSSLASSLFPSSSLLEGLALDFNPASPWLIRFRWLHPFLALFFGGGFLYYYFFVRDKGEKETGGPAYAQQILIVCLSLALFSGLMNLLLLSPVFLKLVHLLMVYLLVMSFILTLEG
ncbi:MAG: COX15/CtaA family protein [Bdellovibrionales bacterium]|nr:COX15/CtaA family protein [Bdellovibrionales bacterium]